MSPEPHVRSVSRRIGPMPRLPLFVSLRGRSCLVVGAGEIGRWKAEALAACGARVTIVDPAAAQEQPERGIAVERRPFLPADVSGRALVVIATADREINRTAANAARAQNVPINVVDAPEESDVIFPAIVDRAPVLVAISTEGTAPVFARLLRRRIEAALPDDLGAAARFAAAKRRETKAALPNAVARRQFWERFFEEVFAADALTEARLEEIYLRQCEAAGPGGHSAAPCVHVLEMPEQPEELSLRALRLLNAADTLVLDAAAAAAVIHHARRESRHIFLSDPDAATLERALAAAGADAAAGKRVLWLRSADHPSFADFAWLKLHLLPYHVAARHLRAAPPPVA